MPEGETTLIRAVRKLASNVIEYGEARYRLVQAEAKLSINRYGGAVSFGAVAVVFAVIGYLPLIMIGVIYLSTKWFEDSFIWPLAIVAIAHFAVAAVFAALAWRRWQVDQENAEIKTPSLAELEPAWKQNQRP